MESIPSRRNLFLSLDTDSGIRRSKPMQENLLFIRCIIYVKLMLFIYDMRSTKAKNYITVTNITSYKLIFIDIYDGNNKQYYIKFFDAIRN